MDPNVLGSAIALSRLTAVFSCDNEGLHAADGVSLAVGSAIQSIASLAEKEAGLLLDAVDSSAVRLAHVLVRSTLDVLIAKLELILASQVDVYNLHQVRQIRATREMSSHVHIIKAALL
jgi:hypothetical protein